MAITVKTETYKRGFLGLLFKILFYAFNAFMALWLGFLFYGLYSVSVQPDVFNKVIVAVAAGFGGFGFIGLFWLLGDALLGALLLATRGKKVIIEELRG
jgi:hypothetical protein